MQSVNQKDKSGNLAIIAGRGVLPKIVADSVGDAFIVSFGSDENALLKPDFVGNMGQIGSVAKAMQGADVKRIIFAGSIAKPNLKDLKLDRDAAKLLSKAAFSKFFKKKLPGDDALFRLIIGYLEGKGMEIVGVDEVVPELLAGKGVLGTVEVNPESLRDIEVGIAAARKLGEDDIGQAVVCAGAEVVAHEDVKGTDAMLEMSEQLGVDNAVLVKCKKPQQDRRIDLPSIGVKTIEKLAALGFAGVAVEAEHSLIIEKEKVLKLADKLGVFVYGV